MRNVLLLGGAVMCLVASAQAQSLKAVRVGSRIDVTVDGAFFTSYRFSEEEKYPFFFPVNGPSGASVTSMRNGEYPHHSSLFFGCDRVNGGNYWQEGLERGQIMSTGTVIEAASGKEIVIRDACEWRRTDAESPLRDARRIAISAPSKTLRQIDFDVTLEALADVTIKKTNHSLFSARLDPDLSVRCGGAMANAQAETGEKGTFGKASPWMACWGSRGSGAVEGLAILQHPANPWYPSPWFTRDYGFFSPTPMFWPADGAATHLAKGDKLRLRYRVLAFAGTPEEAGVAQQFAAYAERPPIRLGALDPGHFHAALVQKRMYPRVAPDVAVYAPEGPDLAMHLKRVDSFNARPDAPTAWRSDVYKGADFLPRMTAEKKGNLVVISGNNAQKARYILASVDVTTHLVDLVQWELFPEQALSDSDVKVLAAKTWKTAVTAEQFARATSVQTCPDYLMPYRDASGCLQLPCNGAFTYALCGVHCKVSVAWNFEVPVGAGDTHDSLMRGKKVSAIIRQGEAQGYKPVLTIEPRPGVDAAALEEPLRRAVAAANRQWPGVATRRIEAGWEVVVPPAYRVGHEAHFGQVAEKVFGFLDAGAMPSREVPNMLEKYRTIMEAYTLSR